MYSSSVYTNCTMIKTVNTTSLRANFKDAMDHVKKSKKPLIVTERGIPTTVLIDIDEFEDYLTAKDKEFISSIKHARSQYIKNEVFHMEDIFGEIK